MKHVLLSLTISLSVMYQVLGQEDKEPSSFGVADEVEIEGAPKFYKNHFTEYYINENWNFRVEIQGSLRANSNGTYSVFDYPFLAKYKVSDKFGVLFGPKIRLFKGDVNIENVSLLSTFRVQYHVTESFSLEGGVNFNLMPNNLESNTYQLDDNMIYKFGGRLRF